ncbi:glycine cleavage system protein H [Anoxybacter fermentans]|uniref:Glycine cleavage system H protein n=1 Tax=Anoxybacter fermentans TaxID=1323375 RepID=A0A3Q9HQ35_9FIRM|nr:glycine cleavage system protein GcvH [Anoxybacter fermentans]AZR72905.1 glycine cleavage system protein H [Anoxybacter fermentans]
MKVLKDLKYTKEHEWIRVEGEIGYIGITDYAQEQLGDVVFVELPEVGEEFVEGDSFAVVDSVKATSDIYMPIDGEILEVNEELLDSPELLNEDPYENWIVKIRISDPDQINNLLNAEEYEEFCAEEE